MWCVRLGWAVKSLLLPSLVCGRSLTGRSVTAALLTVADRCGDDVCCRWNGVASSRWSWRHGQSAVCAVEERLPWRRAPVDAAQRLTPAQVRPSLNYTAFQKGRHQTHGGYSVNSQRIFHLSDSPVNLQKSIYYRSTDPTASCVRRYTTLWDIDVRK